MATRKLQLTREQLASFLKDHQQIRQFELLFSEVNSLVNNSAVPDPATTVTSSTTFGQAATVGTSEDYARADHVHGTPDTAFTSSTKGLAPASGGGTANYLRADGSWAVPPGAALSDGDKGDITVSGGGATWTIDADAVTNAKMADMAQATIKGRESGAGTGNPQDLTGTQATAILDTFTSTLKGLAPASGGGTTNYLRADGTWQTAVTSVDVSGGTTGLTTSGGPVTTSGTITLAGTLAIANGGTGQATATAAFDALAPTTTKGDLIVHDGTDNVRVGVGANKNVLVADSADPEGVVWGQVDLASAAAVTGTLPVGNGGTGAATLAANNVLLGNGTSTLQTVAPGGNGNVLTSNGTTWTSAALPAAPVTSVSGAGGNTGLTLSGGPTGSVTLTLGGTLDADNGGTGQSSYTIGDVLYADTSSTLAKLPDVATGNALISGGVGVAPTYGKVGLTTHVSGQLANANLADMAQATIKGRAAAAGTGAPQDLTGTQATAILDEFTSALKGLAPASGGGTTNFLRADGTWAAPSGGGSVSIGASADLVLSASSNVISAVDPNADRMVFWDDSAGELSYLSAGTNLSISGTSLNASVPSAASTVVSETAFGQSSAVGTGTSYARNDHTHGTPPALTGDVTSTTAGVTTIANNAVTTTKIADNNVTLAKLAQVTGPAFLGRMSSDIPATGNVRVLNRSELKSEVGIFDSVNTGLVPASGGGTTNYLRADGTWQAPPGTVAIGASADAVLSASGNTISGVSAGSNALVFWRQGTGQLEYVQAGEGMLIDATPTLDWVGGTAVNTVIFRLGGTTANTAPIQFQSGSLLTTPVTVAQEFNGTFYATPNTTTGRGYIAPNFGYYQNSAGTAIGSAVFVGYFPANSSINLEAATAYEIEAFAYFLKTTAGTVTFRWLASTNLDLIVSNYTGTSTAGFAATGSTTAAPVHGFAAVRSNTTLDHAATGSLTSARYHTYLFRVRIETNTACNLRLQFATGAGTITPQIGSYYRVIKLVTSGSFAA